MFARFGFLDDAPRFTVSRDTVERMAFAIHVREYEAHGDRYATEEELEMLLRDPCCEWSMVREEIEKALGGKFVSCSYEDFTFEEVFFLTDNGELTGKKK
jgi:hypothetical protein